MHAYDGVADSIFCCRRNVDDRREISTFEIFYANGTKDVRIRTRVKLKKDQKEQTVIQTFPRKI